MLCWYNCKLNCRCISHKFKPHLALLSWLFCTKFAACLCLSTVVKPHTHAHTHTHTHSHFTALCPELPRWASTRRDIHPLTLEKCCGSLSSFWILWSVGKITEASAPTIRLDATPSGPSMPPPASSSNFMPDAFPAATFPIYPGLGKAPNMLDCIPGGLVLVKPNKYLIL